MKLQIALLALLLASCSDTSVPNVELIQTMMESPAIDPQEFDAGSPNNSGMRLPPEGTQPVGFKPYAYADVDSADKNVNPLAGDFSEDVLKVGAKYYAIHCALCHGANGEGGLENNSIGEKMMLKPPVLVNDKIKGWSDGRIYHVITAGQGLMGPYAPHIPAKYRWQVVNYIRHLQK